MDDVDEVMTEFGVTREDAVSIIEFNRAINLDGIAKMENDLTSEELMDLAKNDEPNRDEMLEYLQPFYPNIDINSKFEGDHDLKILYDMCQPVEVEIAALENIKYDNLLVDTPDGFQKVTKFIKKDKERLMVIDTDKHSLTCSGKHAVEHFTKNWIFAENLRLGDMINTVDGFKPITTIKLTSDIEHVYDLSIDHPNHRYYTDGISSHNSGVGKSILMANLAVNAVENKLDVVYITLELAEEVVAKRFDSMFTGVSQVDIFKMIQKVSSQVENIGREVGKLTLKRMPESSTNSNHIRAYLKEYEMLNGSLPDILILDYMDLMTTNNKISVENVFIKDKYVAEEVRSIADEYDLAIVSASQMGRAAIESDDHNQSHIQGGISKINTCDNLIAIVQSEAMKAAGEYMLKLVKTRSSGGVGKHMLLKWDPISLRITDMNDTRNRNKEFINNVETKSTNANILDLINI